MKKLLISLMALSSGLLALTSPNEVLSDNAYYLDPSVRVRTTPVTAKSARPLHSRIVSIRALLATEAATYSQTRLHKLGKELLEQIFRESNWTLASRYQKISRILSETGRIVFEFDSKSLRPSSSVEKYIVIPTAYECKSRSIHINLAASDYEILTSFVHQFSHLLFDFGTGPTDPLSLHSSIADEFLASLAPIAIDQLTSRPIWPLHESVRIKHLDKLVAEQAGVEPTNPPHMASLRDLPRQFLNLVRPPDMNFNPLLETLDAAEAGSGFQLVSQISEKIFSTKINSLDFTKILGRIRLDYSLGGHAPSTDFQDLSILTSFDSNLDEAVWLKKLETAVRMDVENASPYCQHFSAKIPGYLTRVHWMDSKVAWKKPVARNLIQDWRNPPKSGDPKDTANGAGVKSHAENYIPPIIRKVPSGFTDPRVK